MKSYEDFCKDAHEKRVKYMVKYVKATGKCSLKDVMYVFGICSEDAVPIFTDALIAFSKEAK